jgi:hypothetical protein
MRASTIAVTYNYKSTEKCIGNIQLRVGRGRHLTKLIEHMTLESGRDLLKSTIQNQTVTSPASPDE